MTDMGKRIDRVARFMGDRWKAMEVLSLAFPELFENPASMWLAPMDATDEMLGHMGSREFLANEWRMFRHLYLSSAPEEERDND